MMLASLAVLTLAGGAVAANGASGTSFKIVKRIPGPDGFWDYASFDPVHRRLFVAHGDSIMTIDVDTGKVNPHFAEASRSHAVLPLDGGRKLLTTNSGDQTARIFDTATGALKAKIPTAMDPDAAIYDPATRHAMVIDGDAGKVTVIDPVAGKAVGEITVGGGLEFPAVDGRGRLYLNVEDKSEIAVVDTRAGKVVGHYPLPGCQRPTGLALTTQGLLISACANGVAPVLSAATGKLVASIKIGPRPDAVIYDRDRGLAYIPSGGDGTLSVLSVRSPASVQLVAQVPTQAGARTGALDPKTQHIFLPTAKFTPPPAPGQRPGFVPGSFEVLELGPG